MVSSLARYFLAPTEVTKKHLFVLLNVAAGASAFGKLSIASLVEGAYPVLNEQALTLLGYENGPPPDANHLLKRFRDKLEGNSSMPWHGGRTMLRDVFEAILADFVLKQDLGVWREIDDTSVGESVPVVAASEHRTVYFSLDAERGRERRRRAVFALYATAASRFTYLSTNRRVEYGHHGGFASLLYQNSLDSSFRQGRVIMDAKTYSVDLTAVGANSHDDDVKHMDDVFTRLRTLIKKADDGSSKTKWSFSDDVPVLFDLGTTEEGEMDEVLRVFGYSEDDDEDEDE